MGIVIIPLLLGALGAYLAYRTIGRNRRWETGLAIVVGFVFGTTSTFFIMSAAGNALLSVDDMAERSLFTTDVAAVTTQMTITTEYDAEDEDNGTITLRPTSGSTSNFTYVDAETGDVRTVPARGTAIMINENYDDKLVVVVERFAPGTWQRYLFGDQSTIRERIFQLSEAPQTAYDDLETEQQ